MNRFPSNKLCYCSILLYSIFILAFIGCSSSKPIYEDDEWADQWAPVDFPVQKTTEQQVGLEELQRMNRTLRDEIRNLEQENHRLNEYIAELERALREFGGRPGTPTQPDIPAVSSPAVEQFEEKYDNGLRLFRQRQYQEAKTIFTQLLHSDIQHPLLGNCQYWIGESLYGMRQYRQAIDELRKVSQFTDHTKHDDAQVMIANSYFMLGEREQAREEYQRLLNLYPNSGYAAFARQRLRELQ